jgi:hypothetical protein
VNSPARNHAHLSAFSSSCSMAVLSQIVYVDQLKLGWRLTSEGCSYSLQLATMLFCIGNAERDVNLIGNKPEVT